MKYLHHIWPHTRTIHRLYLCFYLHPHLKAYLHLRIKTHFTWLHIYGCPAHYPKTKHFVYLDQSAGDFNY